MHKINEEVHGPRLHKARYTWYPAKKKRKKKKYERPFLRVITTTLPRPAPPASASSPLDGRSP